MSAEAVVDKTTTPLVTAVAEAMIEAGQVTKSSKNKEQGYNFASAEAILGAVRGPLLKRGVILTPHMSECVAETITSSKGTKGEKITISVDFVFRNASEELRCDGWRGVGQDFGDKAIGKAYTNAVKTFIRTAWLLPTEHDDPEGSTPGEHVVVEAPAWTREATRERKAALIEALAPIVGKDGAKQLGSTVASTLGHMPDVLVGFSRAVAASHEQYVRTKAPPDVPWTDPPAAEGDDDIPAVDDPDDPTLEDAAAAAESARVDALAAGLGAKEVKP